MAIEGLEIGNIKAYAAVWGRNILNDRKIVQYVGLGPVGSVIYQRARTFGLDVGFDF